VESFFSSALLAASQRIYAARSFTGDAGIPRLTQNLKKGYVFKPMAYCSAHGLWEGEPIKV
jgi:desulfoferrodoxin (superoxide reductase-like protein)